MPPIFALPTAFSRRRLGIPNGHEPFGCMCAARQPSGLYRGITALTRKLRARQSTRPFHLITFPYRPPEVLAKNCLTFWKERLHSFKVSMTYEESLSSNDRQLLDVRRARRGGSARHMWHAEAMNSIR